MAPGKEFLGPYTSLNSLITRQVVPLLLFCWTLSWAFAFLCPGTPFSLALALLGAVLFVRLAQRNCMQYRYWHWYIAGALFYLVSITWMPAAVERYFAEFHLQQWHGILAFALSSGVMALQFVLVLWFLRYLPTRYINNSALRAPLAWCAAEVLFYNPFPWFFGNLVRSVQPLAQLADLLGVSLVSFVTIWAIALINSLGRATLRKQRGALLAALAVFVLGYANYRSGELRAQIASAPTLNVGLIQGNDPLLPERTDAAISGKLMTYLALSRQLAPQPDLLVWPEGAYFGVIPGTSTYEAPDFGTQFPAIRRPLLFAGLTSTRRAETGPLLYQISAMTLRPDGDLNIGYQKRMTLPLAEDIPFKETFPWLTRIFGERYFLAGESDKPIVIDRPRTRGGKASGEPYSVATLICYEDLIPGLFRSTVHQHNVDLLVGLSNSQWFGESVGAKQQALLASFRAIENGRYFLRATTVGLSQVFDPSGRVVQEAPPYTEVALSVPNIPLLHGSTLFLRVGELPAKLFSVLLLLITGLCYFSQRPAHHNNRVR